MINFFSFLSSFLKAATKALYKGRVSQRYGQALPCASYRSYVTGSIKWSRSYLSYSIYRVAADSKSASSLCSLSQLLLNVQFNLGLIQHRIQTCLRVVFVSEISGWVLLLTSCCFLDFTKRKYGNYRKVSYPRTQQRDMGGSRTIILQLWPS